jgi:putative chitinase
MPALPLHRAEQLIDPLNQALQEFEINTPARAAAFLAQIAHESGALKFFAEIWGPTAAQKRYEGRADLGNTQPGDGKRFKGRGPIQITGRANYSKYAKLLNLPLVDQPELLEQPEAGFRAAAAFWKNNGLNELADQNTSAAFLKITRKINGGTNGLPERQRYWALAKRALTA